MSKIQTIVLILTSALVLGGCDTLKRDDPGTVIHQAPGVAATYAQLAGPHNQRVRLLDRLYCRGNIKIQWSEPDGGLRDEQGEVEVWLAMPDQLAFRAYSLAVGKEYLWLGSDSRGAWAFDLATEGNAVHIQSHEEMRASMGDGPINLSPFALLDLFALTALPPAGGNDPIVRFDPRRNAWVVSASGRGGPMRMFFDVETRTPIRIESIEPSGRVGAFSVLAANRFETAAIDGQPMGAHPKVPSRVTLYSTANPDDIARISFSEVTGRGRQVANERVFDFDMLMRRFSPDKVYGDFGVAAGQ